MLNGEDARAWINEGNVLFQLNRHEQAVAAYDRAIGIDPHSAQAWCNRCNSLINRSEYDLALSSAQKAIQIDPDMVEAYSCREAALMELGRDS